MKRLLLLFAAGSDSVTLFVLALFFSQLASCSDSPYEGRRMTVLCVPVYGQSYALGQEAQLITDFDSLSVNTNHRVLTQRLDEDFGYFDHSKFKQDVRRMFRYRKHQNELSIYGMADEFFRHCDADSILLCTFPGGKGECSIIDLMPGSEPYQRLLEDIKQAHDKAVDKGWSFLVPAFCWMQGENDIVWQTSDDYKRDFMNWYARFCADVRKLTRQDVDPVCICYQSNCLSLSKLPVGDTIYNRPEVYVPNAQYRLIRDMDVFMASGPCYPYHVVNEHIHIDGVGQQSIGRLAGLTLFRIINHQNSDGLQLSNYVVGEKYITLKFMVPNPPLCFDTIRVANPGNYGFTIISPEGKDLCKDAIMQDDSTVLLSYEGDVTKAKVRYAVNGTPHKNGNRSGARGCLHDSQGNTYYAQDLRMRLDNWCFQFEIEL